MSAFSSSGRGEDVSLKLRSQNMRNAKDTTKKLEQENRKMEERLRELKMAMNREKEERERHGGGGGFWQRGQTGTLNNYATEVLHDKTNKSAKKKGVKVLKDEPLDVPKRSSGPGTMKYIAQRSPRGDRWRDKNKGAKCGQCEDRPASLTCVQCSECYCAGCFAAFHLKGALKRHRTIPLHATGPRQCMSPRPNPPASSRSTVSGGGTSGDVYYQNTDRSSTGGGASGGNNGIADLPAGGGSYNNSLLDGSYSEANSAAAFQQALKAWRQGDTTPTPDPKPQPRPRQAIVVSPVTSPVLMVEHSTSTSMDRRDQPAVPDVKSAPHSLTYAQRLMLKQHRRSDVSQLSTPRIGSADTSVTHSSGLTSVTPRLSSVGGRGEDCTIVMRMMVMDFDDEADRVDFQSLYDAMSTSSEQGSNRVTVANLTPGDVSTSPKDQRSSSAESYSSCTVQEISGMEAWQVEHCARVGEKEETASPSQTKRLSKSRETTRVIEKGARIPKSREATRVLAPSHQEEIGDGDGAVFNTDHSHKPSSKELTQVLPAKLPRGELPSVEEGEQPTVKRKPPPAAATPRPKSVKPRPASVCAKSARSRPSSRAHSRAGSRMAVEGLLTKFPSNALAEIARRVPDSNNTQYHSPMEGFFLAGVKVECQVKGSGSQPVTLAQGPGSKSRPVTPAHTEKMKVSNKLYAMSPKSWRPDSSLGQTAPAESTGVDPQKLPSSDSPPVLHYRHSRQLEGQPLSWNPDDSISTPVPPEEEEEEGAPTPTPTPGEQNSSVPTTPTSRQRRRRQQTPDPEERPFSAQRPDNSAREEKDEKNQLRPNSSTGGAEPSKRQRRKLPSIDNDLDTDKRDRARRQKTNQNDGWTGDDEEQDPVIWALSASRTHSWVVSQNSLLPDSEDWETEVQDFVLESGDLEDGGEVTPRAHSRQSTVRSATRSRLDNMEESGRISRAITMDGEDLSKYDRDRTSEKVEQNTDDRETLDRLEWELASEAGRITADGKISRLSNMETEDECRSSGSRSSSSTLRLSYDQGYDINSKLRDDELPDGENEQRARSCLDMTDEQEVRALK
ncbi:hypothetical protein ACOMHN_014668 [Nucella lapillus]